MGHKLINVIQYLNSEAISAVRVQSFRRDWFHKLTRRNSVRLQITFALRISPCSEAVEIVSLMAATWNMPIVSPIATKGILADKTSHGTLTRMTSDDATMAMFIVRLLRYFQWSTIVIIEDLSHFIFHMRVSSFIPVFKQKNITFKVISFNINEPHDTARILEDASCCARVFLILTDGNTLRQLVVSAYHLGMTNGDYAFIAKQDLATYPGRGDALIWQQEDELDKIVRKAFDCVFVMAFKFPSGDDYEAFRKRMRYESLNTYNYDYGNKTLSRYVVHFYEAMLSYASALNNAINDGADIYNGTELVRKYFWNRTFRGMDRNVAIDANGDRDEDVSLYDTDADGHYQVVLEYLGENGELLPLPGVEVHWPNDRGPALNEPPCGYLGDAPDCQTTTLPTTGLIAIVFCLVLTIVVLTGIWKFRKMKQQADLQSQWWRIELEEIENYAPSPSIRSKQSFYHQVRYFNCTSNIIDFSLLRSSSGEKGNHTKLSFVFIQQMRDINCSNLTKFFGLCLGNARIQLVTEYCSRGNLQDLLLNQSIHLDKHFKVSIINDIIQGLLSIHLGPVFVHGNLNSSNCVIDSRFVVKLASFGLRNLRVSSTTLPKVKESDLLSVAPEHLRTSVYNPTQEGDIYSFAMILYELLTRCSPYENESDTLSIDEILHRIKSAESPIFRPTIILPNIDMEIIKIVASCWAENPFQRPHIRNLKQRLKDSTLTTGGNVFDMLIRRMEQYANNLEGLVEEKTHALMEEKKKSEELLYHILPKSVADQLRNGRPVAPEVYDAVTVYFSDIVGFTKLSSSSTPIQVVNLLNTLYTLFDQIIENFDVYKVETIGDAYMVVSGLPIRNGREHVRQIARMSLAILEKISHFKIQHMPNTILRARIGLHSGSVCAGVVGQKMPRYCLFGDTVNTASRMESNGERNVS
ncbi:hypothetical protein ScPMuIL_002439, partial [Solemya velum]